MMHDDRIWTLLSRRLSGEASSAEMAELQQLLAQSPDKQYLFSILHSYFYDGLPPEQADAHLEQRLSRIIGTPRQKTTSLLPLRRLMPYAAAAAVLLLSVLGWGLFHHRQAGEEVLARAGARTHLRLPDGTQVWLNSNSKLKYTNEYNTKTREVSLEGEAWFDVARNPERPFIVHASTLDIKALGTTFTVRSYPRDITVETTLLKGAIEVIRNEQDPAAHVVLKPNEKLVFNKQPAPLPVARIAINSIREDIPDSAKAETSWMYNRLMFDGDNFRALADKMERWYDVHIIVKDEALNHFRFGGVFANEPVEEALKELQLTANFNYTINGKEIELYAGQSTGPAEGKH